MDYFKEIESLLLWLSYNRDDPMTLDQVIAGLKPHICTQFIGKEWKTLNDMKREVVPYDAAHWEINSRVSGEKTWTFANLSKTTSKPQE